MRREHCRCQNRRAFAPTRATECAGPFSAYSTYPPERPLYRTGAWRRPRPLGGWLVTMGRSFVNDSSLSLTSLSSVVWEDVTGHAPHYILILPCQCDGMVSLLQLYGLSTNCLLACFAGSSGTGICLSVSLVVWPHLFIITDIGHVRHKQ